MRQRPVVGLRCPSARDSYPDGPDSPPASNPARYAVPYAHGLGRGIPWSSPMALQGKVPTAQLC